MSPVRTRFVPMVSTRIPQYRHRKSKGYGGGGGLSLKDILANPTYVIIVEDSPEDTFVAFLESVPPTADFELIEDAGGRFKIVDRVLVAGPVATDYETSHEHLVVVRATLGASAFDKAFIVTVTNVVELTSINLSGSLTLAENSAAGTVVGALTSTPPGAALTLTDTAGGRFAISGGNLVAGATPTNYEAATSHNVTVHAVLNGETIVQTFTINVTNVNELTNITLSANSITENSGAGTFVGTLASVIAGATLTLTDSAGGRFAISGNNLVAGSTGTDYESNTSHSITVHAVLGTDTYDKTFTINVQNDVGDDGPPPEVYELTASVSPGNVGKTAGGASAPVTPSAGMSVMGATGGLTYQWTRVSGDSLIVCNSPNSQSTTFTVPAGNQGANVAATWQCVATDSIGKKGISSTNVTIQWL